MAESEMVEKVAKAIYLKRNGQGARPWSLLTKAHRTPYLDDARAAIEAMREPTEAMESAGWDSYDRNDGWSGPQYCWQAMVDAALSPSPAGEGR